MPDDSKLRDFKKKLDIEIKKNSKIFIVGHREPDFDAIGSSIGLYNYVRQLGKKAYIVVDDDDLKIEPGVKKIIDACKNKIRIIKKSEFEELVNNCDSSMIIVTDTNKKSLVSISDYCNLVDSVAVIDHHSKDNDSIESELSYIDLDSSSASEIVSRILNMSRFRYSEDVANYLLAGISLDTKRFKKNTTSLTHDIAEKLIDNGGSIDFVNSLFQQEFEDYCRINNLVINGTIIKKFTDTLSPINVSFTLNRLNPSEIHQKEDYAKACDVMLKIASIDAAFVLGFVDDYSVHVSARSERTVNVGNILEKVYGGGNKQSAGARIDIFLIELSREEEDMILELPNDQQMSKYKEIVLGKIEQMISDNIPYGLEEEEKEEVIDEPKVVLAKRRRKNNKF